MRTVVKLGGDIVKGEIPPDFMADLKKLVQTNQVVLVHGGGDVVTEIATKLAKKLVEYLERGGITAVSLSGLDGGVLRATRKKKLLIVDERGRKVAIEGGY